ncbi:MAG: hypothetical protein ACRD44_19945 [Bryobacteraceae bacterium]
MLLGVFSFPVFSQVRVDPSSLYERVIAVVPYTGSGRYGDERRPLFAGNEGIIQVTCEESDDSRSAVCEFVARDRKALVPILNARRADVKAFEKGRHTRAEIEAEIKKVKKDFDGGKWARGR